MVRLGNMHSRHTASSSSHRVSISYRLDCSCKGLFLGSLDNIVLDNIARLRKVSGQDEVSFHMSGTEAGYHGQMDMHTYCCLVYLVFQLIVLHKRVSDLIE